MARGVRREQKDHCILLFDSCLTTREIQREVRDRWGRYFSEAGIRRHVKKIYCGDSQNPEFRKAPSNAEVKPV